jgi:nicotinamidase-related amidase
MTTATRAHLRSVSSATPYPWPYHGRLDPAGLALLACLDEQWQRADAETERADRLLAELASALRARGGLVVAITNTAPEWLPYDVLVGSHSVDGFHAGPLDGILRRAQRRDLLVAGWGLEGPVHSTLRSANDRGYECLLVADACVAAIPELGPAALSMVMHSGGIFGAYANGEDVLQALLATTWPDDSGALEPSTEGAR